MPRSNVKVTGKSYSLARGCILNSDASRATNLGRNDSLCMLVLYLFHINSAQGDEI